MLTYADLLGLMEERTEAISGSIYSKDLANTLWAYATRVLYCTTSRGLIPGSIGRRQYEEIWMLTYADVFSRMRNTGRGLVYW
jgi:hypothetical protein